MKRRAIEILLSKAELTGVPERRLLASVPVSLEAPPRRKVVQRVRMKDAGRSWPACARGRAEVFVAKRRGFICDLRLHLVIEPFAYLQWSLIRVVFCLMPRLIQN